MLTYLSFLGLRLSVSALNKLTSHVNALKQHRPFLM
jgi:hypothetical protein